MAQSELNDNWASFSITNRDLGWVEEFFYEDGLPHTLSEITERIIQKRLELEAAERQRQTSGGAEPYQPKGAYQVGQKVYLRPLDTVGTITAVRPGNNPRLGSFNVIRVQVARGVEREFAADYAASHPLNIDPTAQPAPLELSSSEPIREAVAEALEEQGDYVTFGDAWFRQDLMIAVNIGHLNIAEAIIDLAGEPQPTGALLPELDLPAGPAPARAFALNYALADDPEERFVNAGSPDAPRWALRRG